MKHEPKPDEFIAALHKLLDIYRNLQGVNKQQKAAITDLSHRIEQLTTCVDIENTALPYATGMWPTTRAALALLQSRPGHIFSRESLYVAMKGGADELDNPRSVDVHISRLRRQLKETGSDIDIRTHCGLGYSAHRRQVARARPGAASAASELFGS